MRLQVNGHPVDYTGAPFCEPSQRYGPASEVTIVNGYHTNENQRLREGDQVVLIQKGQTPLRESWRLMLLARLTPGVYERCPLSQSWNRRPWRTRL
ncbi:MAG: ThiS-like ubiquitin domain-containing protein [Clostridia bacterium]